MHVDLAFALQGTAPIPADHGYALFGALSRLESWIHDAGAIAVLPIAGRLIGDRRMALTPASRLTIRTTVDQIPRLLALAGKILQLSQATVRVGVPEVRPLVPSAALRSRLVVIKVAHTSGNALTAEAFEAAARRQMVDLGIAGEAVLHVDRRRTLGMKQRELVGYEAIVEGLTAEESITLQERGLGGKRHMGCGAFVAIGEGMKP